MKKFFSISNNQALVFISFLSVIVVIAIYLFVYIPQNEMELKEQRFRSMQRVADNVHQKINTSISLMDGLLKASFDKSLKTTEIDNYISNYDTTNFRLYPVETAIDTTLVQTVKKKNISPIFSDAEDGTSAIRVNESTRKFKLYYAKRYPKNAKNSSVYYMAMLYKFDDFIKPLLPENVFDGYVVFSKGNVVYETFPSGLSYTNKDSLLGVRNAVAGSAIRDQEISGIKYKFFLQPVGFDSTNEWIIGGLLRTDRYNNEKKQLPANLVLGLLVTALTLIILLPWIKLFLMGSRDRLTLADGGLSFFVAMLLTSMLFFIILKFNTGLRTGGTTVSETNLAANITKAFSQEVTEAYDQIKSFDSLRNSDNINANLVDLTKKPSFSNSYLIEQTNFPASTEKIKKVTNANLNINQVFWLNDKGHDTYTWTAQSGYAPPSDFSKRNYFKNINDGKPLFLMQDATKPFYIEPLISWTTGTFRTVLSIPSELNNKTNRPAVVAAISLNIKSLAGVIMPKGYQFAITDDKGSVQYHSCASRNLNENLLEEFSENNQLKGAYEAHTEKNFTTDYYSKLYDVYVTPIKGLPYFLLILTDKTYVDTSDIEIFGITLSLTFIFFLFQFILIILVVITIIFSKKSSLKNWYLAASWLWPKRSLHKEYIVTAFYNFLIILLQLIFFSRSTFAENCFMLLPAVSFVTICFNALLAKRYRQEGRLKFFHIKLRVIIFVSILIILINLFAGKVLDTFFGCFMMFQLSAIFLLCCMVFLKDYILAFLNLFKPASLRIGWDYVNSYALMAFTYFIISGGIPVVLFYVSSFNYEQNLLARYRQVEFAKEVLQKNPGVKHLADVPAVYKDGVWIKKDTITHSIPALATYSAEDFTSIQLLNRFRFYPNDVSTGSRDMNTVSSPDSIFVFGNILNRRYSGFKDTAKLYPTYKYVTSVKTQKGDYLSLASPLPGWNFTDNLTFLKLILLILVFILFYLLIYKIIRKLFALDLPDINAWQQLDTFILHSAKLNDHVLIIGAPGSGKLKKLIEKINNGEIALDDDENAKYSPENASENNVYIADLINIPVTDNNRTDKKKPEQNTDQLIPEAAENGAANKWKAILKEAKQDKYKLVIIDHFGYGMNHMATNSEKLSFLEDLMLEDQNNKGRNKKIIILSTVHPYIFLDSLNAQQNNDDNLTDFDLQRWTEVLGHYRIIISPLEHTNPDQKAEKLKTYIQNLETIYNEPVDTNNTEDEFSIEKLRMALSATKDFLSTKTVYRSLSDAALNYERLHNKIKPVINDIEAYLKNRPVSVSSTLLIRIKVILKELLVYAKETASEPGQKVLRETVHTHFLNKLQQPVGEIRGNKNANTDSLSLKMQLTSQHYYMYIWNSLTKEEKFILYDLAEDGLVNTHDIFNLTMLISKGLVLRDSEGTLKVFNKSFRNFVTGSIGYTESKMISKEIRENGSWNKLKTPLLIICFAILALIIISQHEAYTKVVGYLTVLITAVIPFLQKIFSFFEKDKSKG